MIDVESAEHTLTLGLGMGGFCSGSIWSCVTNGARRLRRDKGVMKRCQAWPCCWTIPYVIEDLVVLHIPVCLSVCVLSNMCTSRSDHAAFHCWMHERAKKGATFLHARDKRLRSRYLRVRSISTAIAERGRLPCIAWGPLALASIKRASLRGSSLHAVICPSIFSFLLL